LEEDEFETERELETLEAVILSLQLRVFLYGNLVLRRRWEREEWGNWVKKKVLRGNKGFGSWSNSILFEIWGFIFRSNGEMKEGEFQLVIGIISK